MSKIPKIIHQLWIGPKPAPINLMNTWKNKHPEFEYIFWNEKEFVSRKISFVCQEKINLMKELNGKADIMRWEILYKYGGIFLDADSICLEKFDEEILNKPSFASWENEKIIPGLIATGTLGFPPKHPIVYEAIQHILKNDIHHKAAWITVGPQLLTNIYNKNKYDLYIFPSYFFLPFHHTKHKYTGHGKIYAYQVWGSTFKSYDTMNNIKIPNELLKPKKGISIIINDSNIFEDKIKKFLESIKNQEGHFNIELIFLNVNDKYKNIIDNFIKTTRFIESYYINNLNHKYNFETFCISNLNIIPNNYFQNYINI